MLNFGVLFIWQKTVVFVLSSPKWIHNFLSINHSQSGENSLFKIFYFFNILILEVWPYRYDPVLFNVCGKSFIYVRKGSGIKIDPCRTPQFISPASKKTFSSVTKNFLFERFDWNHLMTDSLKLIHSIFCKSTV